VLIPTVYARKLPKVTLCCEIWPPDDNHRCRFRYTIMGDLFTPATVIIEGGEINPWHSVLPPGDEPQSVVSSYGKTPPGVLESLGDTPEESKTIALHWDALLVDVAQRYKRELLEHDLVWLREDLGCNAKLADEAIDVALRKANAYLRTHALIGEVKRWRGLKAARFRLAAQSFDAKGKRWIRLLHTRAAINALEGCGKDWSERPLLAQVRADEYARACMGGAA